MDDAFLTIPNFTHIQHSCEKLQEWQYGRAFQEILKEVNITTNCFVHSYTCELQKSNNSNNKRMTTGNATYQYFSIDQYGFNTVSITIYAVSYIFSK